MKESTNIEPEYTENHYIKIYNRAMRMESPSTRDYIVCALEIITGKKYEAIEITRGIKWSAQGQVLNIVEGIPNKTLVAFTSTDKISKILEANSLEDLENICLLGNGVYFSSSTILKCPNAYIRENLQIALDTYEQIMHLARLEERPFFEEAVRQFGSLFQEKNKITEEAPWQQTRKRKLESSCFCLGGVPCFCGDGHVTYNPL